MAVQSVLFDLTGPYFRTNPRVMSLRSSPPIDAVLARVGTCDSMETVRFFSLIFVRAISLTSCFVRVPNRIGRRDPHWRTGSSSRRARDASTTWGLREYRVGRVSSELGVAGRRVRSLRLRANDRLPKTQKNAAIVQQSRIIGHYSPKPVFDTKCAYESWLFCVKIARTHPHHFPRFIGEINSSIASHD